MLVIKAARLSRRPPMRIEATLGRAIGRGCCTLGVFRMDRRHGRAVRRLRHGTLGVLDRTSLTRRLVLASESHGRESLHSVCRWAPRHRMQPSTAAYARGGARPGVVPEIATAATATRTSSTAGRW